MGWRKRYMEEKGEEWWNIRIIAKVQSRLDDLELEVFSQTNISPVFPILFILCTKPLISSIEMKTF